MTDDELEDLLDRPLHGELNDEESGRLTECLDSDSAAGRRFVEKAQWDTLLADVIRDDDTAGAQRTAKKASWHSGLSWPVRCCPHL